MAEKRSVRVGDWIDNRYEVFDVREGGMGVVYIVYDHQGESGHRVLAIKTLREDFLFDERQISRFAAECRTWIKLDRHPHIVRAHSVQVIAGTPYVVLELVAGGDLRRWLGTSRLTLPQALRFGIQFCLGMEHALRKGLYCHRDVKPENLLITEGGTLKITDFGVAKVCDERTVSRGSNEPIPVFEDDDLAQHGGEGTSRDTPPGETTTHDVVQVEADASDEDSTLDPWALVEAELGIGATVDWPSRTVDDDPGPSEALTIGLASETIDYGPKGSKRELTMAGAILGTAAYMAPEQLRNAKIASSLADQYSFGVVLFEMIASKPPFQGETFAHVAAQHARGVPPSLVPFIPKRYSREARSVDKIVHRCMEKDPADRYASFGELRLALSRVLWKVAREKVAPPTEVELDAWELTSRGVALGTLGRLDEERETYEEAIRLKPDHVPAWFNQAAVLGAQGLLIESLEYSEMALHLNPGSVPALINKGLALHALRRRDDALTCFDTAAHLQPHDPAIWSGRALVLFSQGNRAGAKAALHQLQRLRPKGAGHAPNLFSALPAEGEPSPSSADPSPAESIPWLRRTEDTVSSSSETS